MEEAIENSTSENAVTYQKYLERCVDRRPAWRARCKQRRLKSRLTTLTHEGPGAFVPQCEMINICPMVSSVVGKIQKNLPKGRCEFPGALRAGRFQLIQVYRC